MKGQRATGWWLALALALLTPSSASGQSGTTFTESTFDHRYDLFYGTVSVIPEGASAPRAFRDAFSVELRVSEEAAQEISSALGDDPRIATGFQGVAPDGGAWFTSRPAPDWWRFPNGPSNPESQASFEANGHFAQQMDPAALGAGGADCSDSTRTATLRGDDFVVGTWIQDTVGPADIMVGEQRSVPFHVADGTTNTNLETSYLVIDTHRVDRVCVIPDDDPPETSISKKPKRRTAKAKAKVKFSADEPGVTFECRLKGNGVKKKLKAFRECNRKAKYKRLDPGKKKFFVRATDVAGNTDPTPARAKWRVLSD